MYIVCDMEFSVPESRSVEAVGKVLKTLSHQILLGAKGDSLDIRASDDSTIEILIYALKGTCTLGEVIERVNEYVGLISSTLEKSYSDCAVLSSYIYPEDETQPYLIC
ncbi:MAG TPA: hypothetical protein DCE14_09110 [Kosmotogaceae bacterium]|nr:MAG: Uncharacterized protein XE05_0475 [Thermotogales bacterium 46_20]HAA86486.1 hypothetical protein [Kosmotogaceae bacterium]